MSANEDAEVASQGNDFPLSEWQVAVEEASNRLVPRVKHRARSAFEHLRKAWRLRGLDNEMAIFRAITAEEEAATALILALQIQCYPGADQLRPWNHVHKSAFWPLILAVNNFLSRSSMPQPIVSLSKGDEAWVKIRIDITALTGGTGEPVWAEPDQPLNFAVRSGQVSEQAVHFF